MERKGTMEVLEAIKTRRSIRAFTDRKISREDLEIIAEAAIYAPSAMNRQSWKFTVVQDKARIEALAAAIRKELGRDEDYNFYRPDVMILASNERDNHNGAEDCACALENIFLAAHALGIGSVWINQLKGICDVPDVRAVLRELKLPENHIVLGMAALGYPAAPPKQVAKNHSVVEWIF